jgi:uracil-DNA glycosylase
MAGSEEDRVAILAETARQVRACTRCRLHEGRAHAVPGEGPLDADVFLIGEAPGRDEDASGKPFVGAAGKILNKALAAARLPRGSVFVTNVVKCRPPANRGPRADEKEACRPYLMTQIAAVHPKVLVTLGSTALRGLLAEGPDLKDARGWTVDFEGIPLIPTYHPAAVLYNRRLEPSLRNDLRKAARVARGKRVRIRSGPPRIGKPTRPTASSGAVVVSPEGRILLLKRADEEIWCLPKGTVEPGETLEETAIREVREETGLQVNLLRPLQGVRYSFYWPPEGTNYEKTVTYFLAEPVGGRLALESGFDAARWVSRADALRLLHWKNDKDVVTRAFDAMDSHGP